MRKFLPVGICFGVGRKVFPFRVPFLEQAVTVSGSLEVRKQDNSSPDGLEQEEGQTGECLSRCLDHTCAAGNARPLFIVLPANTQFASHNENKGERTSWLLNIERLLSARVCVHVRTLSRDSLALKGVRAIYNEISVKWPIVSLALSGYSVFCLALMVGFSRKCLEGVKSGTQLTNINGLVPKLLAVTLEVEVLTFRNECKGYLQQRFFKLVAKCPLRSKVVKGASCLSPEIIRSSMLRNSRINTAFGNIWAK
ncbi:hypothetical protein PR048_020293 [Dryococelus australis]|uniref:Uncharacterized protein n=1 Tax=Dryococelus australis TaxID=614101 RepID=A0ABQ9H605_9NEOP|nr:hypothetical protein PR048_020293 [Dryococelus australis]